MQESELYYFWKYLGNSGRVIRLNGHDLRVIDPGELNLRRGPDFQSARFEMDGIIYHGDVEFHQSRNDWYTHGHQHDKACANVLLHLVGYGAEGRLEPVVNNFSKYPIPTFLIPRSALNSANEMVLRQCPSRPRSLKKVLVMLEEFSEERMELRLQKVLHTLEQVSPPQALYQMLFHAFGFKGNEQAYENLCTIIPDYITDRLRKNSKILYALYIGCAGLLPSKAGDHYSKILVSCYERMQSQLPLVNDSSRQWQLTGLRSCTHPHYRLAGWVELLRRTSITGLLDEINIMFSRRLAYRDLYNQIFNLFELPVSGYWATHTKLGSSTKIKNKTYFSRPRVSECIINAIIPIVSASACNSGSEGFRMYIDAFLPWIPSGSAYSVLLRFFPWYRQLRKKIPATLLHQGLLHLYKIHCSRGHCQSCPVRS